jgi:diguanylate cyclase (GGDEF)-like protein
MLGLQPIYRWLPRVGVARCGIMNDDLYGLEQHTIRLRTVAELGVIGETPIEQARRVLHDARTALKFDYVELGEQPPDGRYERLCAVGDAADSVAIGGLGVTHDTPYMVFDTLDDDAVRDRALNELGMRALLFWSLALEGKRGLITFAWRQPRDEFVSEDEIEYVEFLAALVARLLDVLERQRREAERADTDALTGLANRAAVLDHLNRSMSAAERERLSLALLYLDLNRFKDINDDHGHAAGDAALRAIGLRLQSVLRKHELCGRVGGDEFCVVVSSFKDDHDLAAIARRLLDALTEPVAYEGFTLGVSASIGIAVYPRDGTTVEELLACSDRAMYRAKRERGVAYAFSNSESATSVERPLRLAVSDFRKQFMMCFQPIITARGGRPIAAEVLPRWLQPEGMRSPEVFLKAAREQGVLHELDAAIARVVYEKATELRQVADLTYHINVSEPNESLVEALPHQAVRIAIEVTEAQVAAQPYRYIAFAASCRSRGLRFGVSNFTAHHLSLRALLELRPDFVKIRGASEDLEPEALAAVIEQAHRMHSVVIGEAVETAAQHQWLLANGVDAVQGFAISSPLAEQDFSEWLRRYRFAAVR